MSDRVNVKMSTVDRKSWEGSERRPLLAEKKSAFHIFLSESELLLFSKLSVKSKMSFRESVLVDLLHFSSTFLVEYYLEYYSYFIKS